MRTVIVGFDSFDPAIFERIKNAGQMPNLSKFVCLLYTSDAADERSSVDLGGRRIIKKKNKVQDRGGHVEVSK